jgi:arylsulfatase A-like enzyme
MKPVLLWVLVLACGGDATGLGQPSVVDSNSPVTSGGADSTTSTPAAGPIGQNILLVLIDDIGVEKVAHYGIGAPAPPTPTLDQLANDGLRFSHAYSHPVCSPTRAGLLTGRRPWRTGIGWAIEPFSAHGLLLDEVTLPELLQRELGFQYTSIFVGKWHLGNKDVPMAFHPKLQGFDTFTGTVGNLYEKFAFDSYPQDYTDWELVKDDNVTRVVDYNTTRLVDEMLEEVSAAPEPWLAMLAFNAPHHPFNNPPSELFSAGELSSDDVVNRYNHMIEAVDMELGRLLQTLGPAVLARTTVVVMGDNGTPDVVADTMDPERVKDTPYEGGVRVPMYITGPWVNTPGRVVTHPVHLDDMFATLAEVAGADPMASGVENDSVSLVPLLQDPGASSPHAHVFSEVYGPIGGPYIFWDRMIRGGQYKLIQHIDGSEELYDLQGVDFEGLDLLTLDSLTSHQQAGFDDLIAGLPHNPWPPPTASTTTTATGTTP